MRVLGHTISALPIAFVLFLSYLAYLHPPVGDMWGHIAYYIKDGFPNLFKLHLNYYFRGNPRIGQALLPLAGAGPYWVGLLSFISLCILVFGIFFSATGRRPSAAIADSVLLLTIIAAITTIGEIPFQILICAHLVTNYVFGLGVLLIFAGLYVRDVKGRTSAHSAVFPFLVGLLGVVAGLSNEHTPPALIFFLTAFFAAKYFRCTEKTLESWHWFGFVGLSVGFLSLLLAPGQQVRYGNQVARSFDFSFATLSQKAPGIWRLYSAGWTLHLLIVVVLWILLASIRTRRLGIDRSVALCFVCASFIMALATFASPLTGARLLYASQVMIVVALIGLIDRLFAERRKLALSWLPIVVTFAAYSHFYAWHAVDEYRMLFDERRDIAKEIVEAGGKQVVFEKYPTTISAQKKYIQMDNEFADPKAATNQFMAVYFGLSNVRVNSNRWPAGTSPSHRTAR